MSALFWLAGFLSLLSTTSTSTCGGGCEDTLLRGLEEFRSEFEPDSSLSLVGSVTDRSLQVATELGIANRESIFGKTDGLASEKEEKLYALLDGVRAKEAVAEAQGAIEGHQTKLAIVVLCQKAPLNETFWRELPLNLHSRVYVVLERKGGQSFDIVEVYKIISGGKLQSNLLASVNCGPTNHGFQRLDPFSFYERRRDLKGHHFRYIFAINRGYNELTDKERLTGFYGDLIHVLSKELNFSLTVLKSSDGMYGVLGADGASFNGLVGTLQRGEADITSDLGVTEGRSKAIDYAIGLYDDPGRLYMKTPGHNIKLTTYSNVFSIQFWCMTGVSVLVVLASLAIQFRIYYGRWLQKSESFHFTIACLVLKELDQSFVDSQKRVSMRIVTFSVLLMGYILFASFSGALTSQLAISDVSLPVNSWEELLASPLSFAIEDGTAIVDFIKESKPGTIYNKIYTNKMAGDPRALYAASAGKNLDEVIVQLVRDDYVTFKYGRLSSADYPCHVVDSPKAFLTIQNSLAFTKNFTFLPLFNFYLQKLEQGGVLNYLRRHHLIQAYVDITAECDSQSGDGLDYRLTLIAFLLFAAGVSVAVVLVLLEKIIPVVFAFPSSVKGKRPR